MNRETQHLVVLLLGGALLRISADDTFLRYVRPSHRWLLLAAGSVMVALAAVAWVRDHRGRTPAQRSDPNEQGEHRAHDEHLGHGAPGGWLLVLPVLVIALVAPPALGADSVLRADVINPAPLAAAVFPPLPPGDAPEVGLAEFVQRAVSDTSGALDGRPVTLVGFVVRRGGDVDLARLRITCCAADARPSVVRLMGEVGTPDPDIWLRVVGVLQSGTATASTRWTPAVTVRTVHPAAVPDDPYEY